MPQSDVGDYASALGISRGRLIKIKEANSSVGKIEA
jgi:hypothetical protein